LLRRQLRRWLLLLAAQLAVFFELAAQLAIQRDVLRTGSRGLQQAMPLCTAV
jgi:hypothetical protein